MLLKFSLGELFLGSGYFKTAEGSEGNIKAELPFLWILIESDKSWLKPWKVTIFYGTVFSVPQNSKYGRSIAQF